MKKLIILAVALAALFLAGCNSDKPSVTDQVAKKVDKFNTENAKAIVKEIKTPIEKARMTQNLGEERTKAIDQALQNQ